MREEKKKKNKNKNSISLSNYSARANLTRTFLGRILKNKYNPFSVPSPPPPPPSSLFPHLFNRYIKLYKNQQPKELSAY